MNRTGHPHANGQFLNCDASSDTAHIDSTVLKNIKELRLEFDNFRRDIREMYQDMEEIKKDVQNLSDRIECLENLLAESQLTACSNSPESIMEEIEEREERSVNLIFLDLDEPDGGVEVDLDLATLFHRFKRMSRRLKFHA